MNRHAPSSPDTETLVTPQTLRDQLRRALAQRGFSGDAQNTHMRIYEELLFFLSGHPPDAWQSVDLDVFMRSKAPSLQREEKRVYATMLGLITEVLHLHTKHRQPPTPDTPEVSKTAPQPALTSRATADNLAAILDVRPPQPRTATRNATPALQRPDTSPPLSPLEPTTRAAAPPSHTVPTPTHDRSNMASASPPVAADPRQDVGLLNDNLDLVLPDDDLDLVLPDDALNLDRTNDHDTSAVASPVLDDDDLGLSSPDDLDLIIPPQPPPSSTPSSDTADLIDRPPEVPEVATPEALTPRTWSTSLPMKVERDGRRFIDKRFTVPPTCLIDPAHVTTPRRQPGSTLQALVERHASLVGAAFAALTLGLILLISGVALLGVPLLIGGGLGAGTLLWIHQQLNQTFTDATSDPTTRVRAYLAALRLGLYTHAKAMLASPRDVEPVPPSTLRDLERDPLGVRFNTLSPAALEQFWQPHVSAFDDPTISSTQQRLRRIIEATSVHVTTLLKCDDDTAYVFAVAATDDRYALVPVIQIDDAWWIADGEWALRSARYEALLRWANRHDNDQVDNDTFVERVQHHHVSTEHIARAHRRGHLNDEQFELLSVV